MDGSMSVVTDRVAKPAKARKSPQHNGNAIYYLYALPGVVLFLGVFGGSWIYNAYLSLTKWDGIGEPKYIGLDNYRWLMQDHTFWMSFLHAIEFIAAMALIPTVLGLLLGALIFDFIATRFGAGVSTFLRASLFVPQIIPITVSGVLWAWLLTPNVGVVNTFLRTIHLDSWQQDWLGNPKLALFSVSVMLVWIQIGYTIVIFVSGMARIDPALHEAAQLDGANWLQRFRVITIPTLIPEISVVLLTTTVAALKVFGPVYTMTQGGPGDSTQVPSFFSYFHFFTTLRIGYGAAVATILSVILTILAVVMLKVQNRIGGN